MSINLRFWKCAGAMSALITASQFIACTTDDTNASGAGGTANANGGAGNAAGSNPGGSTSVSNGGNTSVPANVCSNAITLTSTVPGIADFDTWDGTTALGSWNFPLGGDTANGVLAGPFGYGDRTGNLAETFDMVTGANSTKYALRVADTNAVNFGGGLGLWLSACINANTFTGISFWVRGVAPTGKATLKISMAETTSATPATGKPGTCPGTDALCIHPMFEFPVTDTWTQIKAPWTGFKPGDAAGTLVGPTGNHITQIGVDIGLVWVPGDAGAYVPTPAAYELVVDSMSFY